MYVQGDMEVFTKSKALAYIEQQLGFPKPVAKYLHWYYDEPEPGFFVPKVNFTTLAREIEQKNFVKKLEDVIALSKHHPNKETVFMQIHSLVNKHIL